MPHPLILAASPLRVVTADAAFGLAPDAKLLRLQIAPIGAVVHDTRYGEIHFTAELAATLAENFKLYSRRVGADYSHGTYDPRDAEDGKSAGRVLGVKVEDNDAGEPALFAYIKPTPRALQYVEAEEYELCSPEIGFDVLDPTTGDTLSAVLQAVALTNRPAIPDMNTVGIVPASTVALRQENSMDAAKMVPIADHEKLAADHARNTVLLAETAGKVAANEAELAKVRAEVVVLTAARDGKDAQILKLAEDLSKAEGALKSAADEKKKSEAEAAVDAAIAAGKAPAASRESLLKAFDAMGAEHFAKCFGGEAPEVVPMSEKGKPAPAAPPTGDAEVRLKAFTDAKAKVLCEADPKMSLVKARVLAQQDPEYRRLYSEAFRSRQVGTEDVN